MNLKRKKEPDVLDSFPFLLSILIEYQASLDVYVMARIRQYIFDTEALYIQQIGPAYSGHNWKYWSEKLQSSISFLKVDILEPNFLNFGFAHYRTYNFVAL
jgi:hypothetical protein